MTSVDVHLNWRNWFQFLIFDGGLLVILIYCMIFQSPFLDVISRSLSIRMSISGVSFLSNLDPGILCLSNAFPLTYDLRGFKSRINRHLLSAGSF